VGEFLTSLDLVDGLDARLALAGHARPFTEVHGHIDGNRALVRERLDAALRALRERGEATAFELLPAVYGDKLAPENTAWLLTKMLCYLEHLELAGALARTGGEPVCWAAA
jgi:hypothetical protein